MRRALITGRKVSTIIAESARRGTASLVACDRLAAAGAPMTSPTAQARLSIIVATTSGMPSRSEVSVMTVSAGMV